MNAFYDIHTPARNESYHAFRYTVISVRSGNGAAANCAALPIANADRYATSICKPPLFWFPCTSGGVYKRADL